MSIQDSIIWRIGLLTFCAFFELPLTANAIGIEPISSQGLPDKTLILTIDDGPTERIDDFIEVLRDESVSATFFLCGNRILEFPDSLEKLTRSGHIIGNHTFSHPRLSESPDPVEEVMKTDALLSPLVPESRLYFRPPFGDWTPEVARILQHSAANRYLGPFFWDIDGYDWSCWENEGLSIESCGQRYLDRVHSVGRGVILLHDHSLGKTVEMLRWLIPILKKEGYRFVNLNAIAVGGNIMLEGPAIGK